MKIHCYAKQNENLSVFDKIVPLLKKDEDEIYLTMENRRSFQEFEKIQLCNNNTIFVVSSLNSLGLNDADIATKLSWFINNSIVLVIIEIPSTFEYGIHQPINRAILDTLLQAILSGNKNIVTVNFGKTNSGRSKIPFPENWSELYEQWENHQISSKEFIDLSGVKKATFYNLITEYREMKKENDQFLKKYLIG